MWDLQKTLNTIAGIRKREALGLPPFHMTPEEQAEHDKRMVDVRRALAKHRAEQAKRGPWKPNTPPGQD